MKAKYQHEGNECLIYDQAICEDNIVVTVRTYKGSWTDIEPQITTKVCLTNAEARRLFFTFCEALEQQHYKCVYKEAKQ